MSPTHEDHEHVVGVDDVGHLVELSKGMYADSENENVLIVHLSEVITHLGLDDTQETRASIYGAWDKFCTDNGIELVLVQDPEAPSVVDASAENPLDPCKCGHMPVLHLRNYLDCAVADCDCLRYTWVEPEAA